MKILSFFAFCLFVDITKLKFCSGDEELHETPILKSKQGLIKGITERSLSGREFYSYMSIPFAKPPIGKLRFKDPISNDPWSRTLDGTKLPDFCLQYEFFDFIKDHKEDLKDHGKEDCLYLNVYTTQPNKVQAKLPVMVFIHGGGFFCGSSHEYLPHVLLNEEVVLVVIQYRLGIFGFLSTEDSIMPGNMGLKDQQLALKWVKDNIREFGGDSDRITIFGESAGGASVHYHILSPGSKGLFHRAIVQSGTALCPWSTNENLREFAVDVGNTFNCSTDLGSKHLLDCLQKVDAQKLVKISMSTLEWGIGPIYVLPRVDGEFLPDFPETLLKEERYNKVDVMSGITRDEGALVLFMMYGNPTLLENLRTDFEKFGPMSLSFMYEKNSVQLATQLYERYLQGKTFDSLPEINDQIAKLFSDRMFGVCHDTVANVHARDEEMDLYLYQFDHLGDKSLLSFGPDIKDNNYVGHGDELFYLFSGGPLFQAPLTRKEDLRVREILLSLWTNFAKTGNPNSSGASFKWEKATGERFRHLSLTTSPTMMDDSYQETRKFWSSLNLKQNAKLGLLDEEKLKAKTEL